MRLLFVSSFCIALACPATAGPWLREKGAAFTSLSFTLNPLYDTTSATFIEYGLRDDMTVGADIGIYRNSVAGPSGVATLFLRRPIGKRDGTHLWAYELGLGANWQGLVISPHVEAALTWGRGLTFRDKGGWMTVDASYLWDMGVGTDLAKLDGTVGLNVSDRIATLLQLYVSHSLGDTSATWAPSVVYTPTNGWAKWQLGLESPFDDADRTAVKFGLWREF